MKEANVKSKRVKCILLFAFLLCCAGNIFAQDLDTLAEKINYGTTEQRREALFQIRNLKSAEASRIALPALRDPQEIVRATATSSVIYLPGDEAVNNLLPLLNDKS